MDTIQTIAERLAEKTVLNELADEAIKSAGFVKLADNEWLAPLVGAGLGATGGGLAGYLSSPEIEDAKNTRKRMLIGALTGGGLGGGLGAVYNKLGVDENGRPLISPLSEKSYTTPPKHLPWTERAGIGLSKVKVPFAPEGGWSNLFNTLGFMSGGTGKTNVENWKGGLGRLGHLAGEKLIAMSPKIEAWNQNLVERLAGKKLLAGSDPILRSLSKLMGGKEDTGGHVQDIMAARQSIPGELADERAGWADKYKDKATFGPHDPAVVKGYTGQGKLHPDTNMAHDFNQRVALGSKTPEQAILLDRLHPAIKGDSNAVAAITDEAMAAANAGYDHPMLNPKWAEKYIPGYASKMGPPAQGEAAQVNRILSKIGVTPTGLRTAAGNIEGSGAIKGLPERLGRAGRVIPRALAAELMLAPMLGAATYRW